MSEIILDIETIPNPANSKEKLVIAEAKIERKKGDNKDKNKFYALNPELGKIVCICLDIDGKEYHFFSQDEGSILKDFWKMLEQNKDFRIVTFNGKQFDIPYIIKRSILNGVVASQILNTKKYEMYKHFDVFEVLTNFSSFNNAFKKHTGITPKEFKKRTSPV